VGSADFVSASKGLEVLTTNCLWPCMRHSLTFRTNADIALHNRQRLEIGFYFRCWMLVLATPSNHWEKGLEEGSIDA
jgi:hypothetical protein